MPSRLEIIEKIGKEYVVENIENGEFSYPKSLKAQGKTIDESLVKSKDGTTHKNLDIRFIRDNISILVETKDNYDNWDKDKILFQMQAYVNYEKVLTGNKIIAILANTDDDRFKVWWGSDLKIDDSHQLNGQYLLKSFDEYAELYLAKKNNKEEVIKNTYALNKVLHKYGIKEEIRSQFVGTCLLSLKEGLAFEGLKTKQIIAGIEDTITNLLEKDLNKNEKLVILKNKVLDSQDVRELKDNEIQEILRKIKNEILPHINDRSTMGQDILNLFFTTFNKYVTTDKNQAFTPDHIVHFMCQVVGINRNTRVLDPCCGSGAFLVRALTEAMDDCANESELNEVKKKHIYGIEQDERAFGLSTTNMLIHLDGNSNVKQGSCFDIVNDNFIEDAKIDVVLMNPPYNAQKNVSNPEYTKTWNEKTTEDPSQGFHYVYYIASKVKTGKLAVLLPMQCAIGSENMKDIKKYKELMLQEHTLDAVFSLPSDMFHPGASANACCMVFELGIRHCKKTIDEDGNEKFVPRKETFFGYFKDDGFYKKKNLGRVEKTKEDSNEGVWNDIESKWLELYRQRREQIGLSACKSVTWEDEWLCEAYMETDCSILTDKNFEKTIKEFASYKIITSPDQCKNKQIETDNLHSFRLDEIFAFDSGKVPNKTEMLEEGNDIYYIAAKKKENGINGKCAYNKKYISKGNCIVFICDGQGSIGYNNYMDKDFIGTVNLELGYNENLNQYNAMYLVTVLDLERPKFSFGRKRKPTLESTKIQLPAIQKDDGTYEPNWQYMEDYIKSLPYADLI